MKTVSKLLNVELLDRMIIGKDYYSFREDGILK